MQVFKFGGASVKDAQGVKNLAAIVVNHGVKPLLLVVSAMGKTTNALEKLTDAYFNHRTDTESLLAGIRDFHEQIISELFTPDDEIFNEINNTLIEIEWMLEDEPHPDYDFNYDQMVSIGELLATRIVNAYLNRQGVDSLWLDARSFVQTDNRYREGKLNWEKSSQAIKSRLPQLLQNRVVVTQGFIGGTSENFTTTLGREGSDFSAAIFASCLNASSLTVWKDVDGILNADPKLFSNTVKYAELPYQEAMEMSYYGATIIHPKTIKPLQQHKIPLYVKPFGQPEASGTVIHENATTDVSISAVIVKQNQVLMSLFTREASFINENHIGEVFNSLASLSIKVNVMQTSALSLTICFDMDSVKFNKLIGMLSTSYTIRYNENLQLITIRHYKPEIIDELTAGRSIMLEQLSRSTAQLVLK